MFRDVLWIVETCPDVGYAVFARCPLVTAIHIRSVRTVLRERSIIYLHERYREYFRHHVVLIFIHLRRWRVDIAGREQDQ
jgi:hypothetical protein